MNNECFPKRIKHKICKHYLCMKEIRGDKRMNENVTRYKNIKSFTDKETVLFTQPDPTPVISKLSA